MTRCYEFYCWMKRNPEGASCGKSKRDIQYIRQYMREMKKQGVKFNGEPKDKDYFEDIREKIGSERTFCQTKTQHVAPTEQTRLVRLPTDDCPECGTKLVVLEKRVGFKLERADRIKEPQWVVSTG